MKKNYEVKNTFGVGEIDKELKKGTTVAYDIEKGVLYLNGQTYDTKNLKAAIKAEWLVPVDGNYPKLDGPLGETVEEANDRRRKERFAQQAEDKEVIEKDARVVGKIVGAIDEEKDPNGFWNELDVEPVASNKPRSKKAKYEVFEDDTQEVVVSTFEDKDTKAMKKALNQDKKDKIEPANFKVFEDHYDAESIHIGKYNDASRENTLKTWSKLHWTKKADVIKQAEDKTFLTQLKGVETSKKIQERITKRIEVL